jgi:hypothetical protein
MQDMIKQIAGRLLAAIFTFIIGLSAFTLWYDLRRQESSPCDSVFNLIDDDHREVRIRGMLYGSPDRKLTLNELDCSGVWVAVEFNHSYQAGPETREFIERLNDLADSSRMSRAEVIVTGTLTSQPSQGNDQPFAISATALEQTGPISLISLISN